MMKRPIKIKRPLGMICLVVVLILFLRTEYFSEKESGEISFETDELCLTGTVYKKDLAKQSGGEVLYIKDVLLYGEGFEENGKTEGVICYLSSGSAEAEIGSSVLIKGKPSGFEAATNPGQFDRKFYYRISGISFRLSQAYILAKSTEYDELKEALYRLRRYLAERLDMLLPGEDGAVMKAILLGSKSDMEEELKALYQRNGIGHILAISGLHISLLGMGAFGLLKRTGIPMGGAAFLAAVLIFLYGLMTGFAVSMVRAVIMFLLHMSARILGRTYDMMTAAGVAAVLILLEEPLYIYYGGFVFSFGCVIGIGLVLPELTKTRNPMPKKLQKLISGVAMAVVSYPMYLWFYYQFPVYSILLNLLVIPLMSLLMAAGLLLLALGAVWTKAAYLPALLIHGILKLYQWLCSICDGLPGHIYTPGKPQGWQMSVYVGILVFVALFRSQKKALLKWKWSTVLAGVILLSISFQREPEITFLDVGQGDCIYVKSETGKVYLIDGGSTSVSSVGEYRILPFLKYKGAREIEAVFITHPDEDHINGILELLAQGDLQGISIKNMVLPEIDEELKEDAYGELEQQAGAAGVSLYYIQAGEMLKDGEMTFQCLNPKEGIAYGEANEYSTVLLLRYGDFSALFTGDAEGEGEQAILQALESETDIGSLTVLKAAHHGSKYSTSEELLKQLKPQITVISCGKNNQYGHPHEETIERLAEIGTVILTTPQKGAITIKPKDAAVECFLDTE